MKKKVIIIGGILIVIIASLIVAAVILSQPVSKHTDVVSFEVNPGDNKITIVNNLKNANIIKSKTLALIYIFFSDNNNLQAGTYLLDRHDSMSEIFKQINAGITKEKPVTVRVTFIEGKRFTEYAKLISDNFAIEYDEIIATVKDQNFLKELINDYWFLDNSILNKDLYYPLEGYLFPDTYEFYQNVDIKSIIYKMLDQMENKLNGLKDLINDSKYSVHELLTMASIIEKEAINNTDRKQVSQVIYKRLDTKMSLGMDVTTYYGVQKDLKQGLTQKDLDNQNPYNTRNNKLIGLPVGAICSPSLSSIEASLKPSNTDYLYFVADVTTGKVYFASTYDEFKSFKIMLGL